MPRMARMNDYHKGICDHAAPCCPHIVTGPIVEASGNVRTNGKGTARLNDKVIHDCPHCGTGYIAEASGSVFVNGRGAARLGDRVVYPGGEGKIIEGSRDTNAGG